MEKRTSAFARIFAALALVGSVVVLIVVIGAANESDSGNNGERRSGQTGNDQKPQRTKAKAYVVKSGDTLTAIAHRTGVPVAEILALNPEVDPQILIAGETLKLR